MSLKYRWIIIPDDNEPVGTNDSAKAGKAAESGEALVLDLEQSTSIYDGDVSEISEAP